MLKVMGLTKQYGDRFALQGVSFAIAPRTFTAVLGPSGAGKTTLMRCLLGLSQSDSGSIWFGDRELTRASPRQLRESRRQMAVVAQQFNLVRRRTSLENCLAGRLPELPLWRCLTNRFPQSFKRDALAALERVKLLDVAFQRADRLSGGQQQRVAIARALTQNARIVLADEPISSLDPESARLVLELLRALCDREGITVFCNLHQASLARYYWFARLPLFPTPPDEARESSKPIFSVLWQSSVPVVSPKGYRLNTSGIDGIPNSGKLRSIPQSRQPID